MKKIRTTLITSLLAVVLGIGAITLATSKTNEVNSVYTHVDGFMENLKNSLEVCQPEGTNLEVTTTAWEDLATQFENLELPAQSIIAGTRYTHGKEKYNSREDLIDRYDYIISKYSQFNDFMSRKNAGTYQNNYGVSPENNVTAITVSKESAVIIVVVASVVSISMIGILLIIKKHKQN